MGLDPRSDRRGGEWKNSLYQSRGSYRKCARKEQGFRLPLIVPIYLHQSLNLLFFLEKKRLGEEGREKAQWKALLNFYYSNLSTQLKGFPFAVYLCALKFYMLSKP